MPRVPLWAWLALPAVLAGAAGLLWSWSADGEAVGLGELLLGAAALALASALLAAWRPPQRPAVAAGMFVLAALFGWFGYWACWAAGWEGDCLLFG